MFNELEILGLMKCSKIAMRRNIDINTAVAANPNEMAFIDMPKSFHVAGASLLVVSDEAVVGSVFHCLVVSPNLSIFCCSIFFLEQFSVDINWPVCISLAVSLK
jgi:hypothetical protein